MVINVVIYFFLVMGLAIGLGWVVRAWAWQQGIVDRPDQGRKQHHQATALLGGLAVAAAFFTGLFLLRSHLIAGDLEARHWLGFALGSFFLMLGGYWDDKYRLTPAKQLVFPFLAIIAVLAGGVEIDKLSHPLGGYIDLQTAIINLLSAWAIPWLSTLLVFFWLLGMMFTTKLLDGVDGLVTGVSSVGALIMVLFTLTTQYYQPDIAYAALMLLAACLGFLTLNWHPAKIFLGESGSLFLGFALGVLSIISGSKIALALLVMGLPIMDVAWTIIQRWQAGQNPFTFADRRHLHFRLQDMGWSPRQITAFYSLLAGIFGGLALFLQARGKMLALAFLAGLMFLIIMFIRRQEKKMLK